MALNAATTHTMIAPSPTKPPTRIGRARVRFQRTRVTAATTEGQAQRREDEHCPGVVFVQHVWLRGDDDVHRHGVRAELTASHVSAT